MAHPRQQSPAWLWHRTSEGRGSREGCRASNGRWIPSDSLWRETRWNWRKRAAYPSWRSRPDRLAHSAWQILLLKRSVELLLKCIHPLCFQAESLIQRRYSSRRLSTTGLLHDSVAERWEESVEGVADDHEGEVLARGERVDQFSLVCRVQPLSDSAESREGVTDRLECKYVATLTY